VTPAPSVKAALRCRARPLPPPRALSAAARDVERASGRPRTEKVRQPFPKTATVWPLWFQGHVKLAGRAKPVFPARVARYPVLRAEESAPPSRNRP
jgi:hypothetical protein